MRERLLRERAIEAGLRSVEELLPDISPMKALAGRLLFESKLLSLNKDTACQTCHLDKFGSADGIPLGVGTGGSGEGVERIRSGGDMLPRNTLPLWGRGSTGFSVFFWDGKVDGSAGAIRSQFLDNSPSVDPLVVAVHLPIVEIREMVPDSAEVDELVTETRASANRVYAVIAERVKSDPELSSVVATSFGVAQSDINVSHVAESIAEFIRDHFQVRETPFHAFVFKRAALGEEEIAGGLIFYGKGQCAACHNGPFFSDLRFHAIPFGQLGFGKNGFGIDYGRFNITLNPGDLYKFRTPPLFNVTQTAPYSHSGSVFELDDAVRAHVDPLSVLDVEEMTEVQRVEFYKRLRAWASEPAYEVYLHDDEVRSLVAFLGTLSFTPTDANSRR